MKNLKNFDKYAKFYDLVYSKKNCLMVNVKDKLDLSKAMIKILRNNYPNKMKLNAQNFLKLKKIQNVKNILKLEAYVEKIK
jgi:hypothetical protein|tara:strand:+ start:35 stop:277 length:243 start_codon:yes stop_codon:yes gene_type:complete